MSLSVMKFGGSSVADITAMHRSAQIIKATPKPQLIIVSALAGVTRKLMSLSYQETSVRDKQSIIKEIQDQHYKILNALKNKSVQQDLDHLLAQVAALAKNLKEPQDLDELLSLGERMASCLFTEVLKEEGEPSQEFDVREVMRTDSHFGKAEPIISKIAELSKKYLEPLLKNNVVVTQGFIGADENGHTTILGKESSDYTAALLAEALHADHFKIWTDVAGVFSADPKLYAAAKPISHLSFGEALELTTFGAKVLHSRTLEPAIRKNMRCFVGSSIKPEGGTWINNEVEAMKPQVKAISIKNNQMLLRLERSYKTSNLNFLENFVELLAQHQIDFDLLVNHGLSTSLVLDDSLAQWHHKSLLSDELRIQLQKLGKVEINQGLTLLALVGQDIPQCPKIKKILTETLQDLEVHAFYYGSSPYSLCVLTELKEHKVAETLARLHQQLIG